MSPQYTIGSGTSVEKITEARQLVVYTRTMTVGGAADPGAPGAGSDSDSSDSSDSDNQSKRKVQVLGQAGSTTYGQWYIAEMHQSVANVFGIPPAPGSALGKA